jgi:hypothetical protein
VIKRGFTSSGYVNSQNSWIWRAEKPQFPGKTFTLFESWSVLCCFSAFFTETVTAEHYQKIIEQLIALLEEDEQSCRLQQDGATAHAAILSMQMLRKFFEDYIISHGLWHPIFPNLSPPDFYLWGYLKANVYKNNPRSLDELKQNI